MVQLLEGKTWYLKETIEGTEITALFEEGMVSGSAGCNTYQGAYTLDGPTLTFGPAAVTRKACESPIMEQEQRYLAYLEEVSTYTIVGSQLRLDTGDGRALLFTGRE